MAYSSLWLIEIRRWNNSHHNNYTEHKKIKWCTDALNRHKRTRITGNGCWCCRWCCCGHGAAPLRCNAAHHTGQLGVVTDGGGVDGEAASGSHSIQGDRVHSTLPGDAHGNDRDALVFRQVCLIGYPPARLEIIGDNYGDQRGNWSCVGARKHVDA